MREDGVLASVLEYSTLPSELITPQLGNLESHHEKL